MRVLLRVEHPWPLLRGRLVDRYQRFTAEIELDSGERIRAHCVNPGRMEGQVRPGARAWVSPVPAASKRKLRYTWELVEEDGRIVGVNTVAPNRVVGELLAARVLPGLRRFRALHREVAYAERSRVDFLLDGATPHYLEVKNCHLRYADGRGYFPDSVSARATHHLRALTEVVAAGAKATVLFTIQRPDIEAIRPSILHDPEFAAAARAAGEAGVRFRAVTIQATPQALDVIREIPVELAPYQTHAHARWQAEKLPWSGWRRDPRRVTPAEG
ncbi:DNA/RNA nuclease SfsA [Enhygromyxa salina]|uniref:Sugar fermentation stimulation protein homolog n=1 Tax=Enhygromyxa salina TaxID=215803 RepID=A0A2S9YIC3_9BACT|nr:DNA/RNA nuclease SfsA [Enhygromyxa salina]PRQ04865.1 Sugar fermentation stimulation protein A [Enhygromyxa salina]